MLYTKQVTAPLELPVIIAERTDKMCSAFFGVGNLWVLRISVVRQTVNLRGLVQLQQDPNFFADGKIKSKKVLLATSIRQAVFHGPEDSAT